jgi:hypothetical protein
LICGFENRSGRTFGEDALETAPVFFHYANALLFKEEEASSKEFLGEGAGKKVHY